MKNSNYQGQAENNTPIAVSVTLDEAPLLKNLVEKLAHRRYDIGYIDQLMPSGWQAIETSTIEAYVSGCMDIQEKEEYIALAYTTCFSFTCTKAFGGENSLSWVNSLS
jgi:hypothetical protein